MARTPDQLSDADLAFLAERHLATLTTLRPDGSPHVVAIAFGYEPEAGRVWIITREGSHKVRNVERDDRVVVTQVDGRRWLSLEGKARVARDTDTVAEAVRGFEARYRPASENPERVAIVIDVTRVLGRA